MNDVGTSPPSASRLIEWATPYASPNAMRQLGKHLADKWERQRSLMIFYVRSRDLSKINRHYLNTLHQCTAASALA